MEENNYVVYRHTSSSGKVYIGITSQKPEYRWNNGEGYKGSTKFYAVIKKYGWDNFKHEILYSGLNEISAKMIEEDLIYYYKQQNISLNITNGGDGISGYHHTEEARKKISEASKEHKFSEETRKKLSEAKKGKTYMKGKHHSAETKKRMSASHKCKEVNQFSKDGILVATYPSVNEARRNTDILHISQCCRGNRKSAGGFIWKFKE